MMHPHILMFMTDNHPLDHIGCMNLSPCRTATFDRIGTEGVVMQSARTTSAVCSPARASIFTGFQPHQAGIPTVHLPWKDQWGVEQGEQVFEKPCITNHLREIGYECLYAGKWHVGRSNVEDGFDRVVAADESFQDYMDWCSDQGIPNGFIFRDPERGRPFRFHEAPHMVQPHTAPLDIPPQMEHNRWMLNEGLRLLGTRDPNRPLFMVFSTYGPHPPLCIPEPYYSMYDPSELEPPEDWGPPDDEPDFYRNCYYRRMFDAWGSDFDSWRKSIAVSWGYATYIDSLFGEFLNRYEQTVGLENTLFIMLSDHGDMMGRRGLWRIFCPYEPAIRMPWLMRWPGMIPPGIRCSLDVSLPDVAATILSAAGVDLGPLQLEGVDVISCLKQAADWSTSRDCFSQFNKPTGWGDWLGVDDWRCIVRRPWKMVVYQGGAMELFDLNNDANERQNLFNNSAAHSVQMELLQALVDWSHRTGDSFDYPPPARMGR